MQPKKSVASIHILIYVYIKRYIFRFLNCWPRGGSEWENKDIQANSCASLQTSLLNLFAVLWFNLCFDFNGTISFKMMTMCSSARFKPDSNPKQILEDLSFGPLMRPVAVPPGGILIDCRFEALSAALLQLGCSACVLYTVIGQN